MYGEENKKEKAIEYKHMLFSEAAQLAAEGLVKELWLTHYSPSLTEQLLYRECETIFFKYKIRKRFNENHFDF